jgi:hypothetical protein
MAGRISEDGDQGEPARERGDRQDSLDAQERRVLGSDLQQLASLYSLGALMKRILGPTLAVTASLALATTASAEPLRIRGTIVATSSNSITVHTANGDVTASLNAKTGFVSVVPSNLNSVGPGSYLGVASKADGDKRIALSVIVFPPEMNGAAEGNAVCDPLPDTTLFGGARTVSSMTNANVKAISPGKNAPRVNSAMTNASVATATAKAT